MKDLLYGELAEAERQRLRAHVDACEDCRMEYERLRMADVALRALPADQPTTHIRFVSDKVFEPVWWQRVFGAGGRALAWQAAFTLPVWIALALVLAQRGMAPAPAAKAGASGDVQAEVRRMVDERMGAAVAQAVAGVQARDDERLKAALASYREQYQRDQQHFAQSMDSDYRYMDQKVNRVAYATWEKIPAPVGQ